MRGRALPITLALLLVACADERPAGGTEEERTAAAALAYDPSAFDTISWASDSAALARGADVWKWAGTSCHGERGGGDAMLVTEAGDTLRGPSLVEPNWPYARDEEALRRRIFTGTVAGMPHWGLRGLTYRDLDAVARHVREVLRAEAQAT